MKKYILVKQDDLKDCGVSCLMMVLRTYKGGCSKEYLRWLTNTTKDGTTAYDLIEALKKFHFDAHGYHTSIEYLEKVQKPIIAHVIMKQTYKHFVVIYNIDLAKNKITIADPGRGIEKMSIDEFKSISTGNYIIAVPQKQIPCLKVKNTFSHLIRDFLWKQKFSLIILFFLSILFVLFTCGFSYYTKFLLDKFSIFMKEASFLKVGILCFLLFSFLKGFLNYVKSMLFVQFCGRFDQTIFKNVYEKIISLPYIYFRNRTTGEVMSRVHDLTVVKDLIVDFLTTVSISFLLLVASFLLLARLSYRIALLVGIIFIFFFLLFWSQLKKIKSGMLSLKEENSSFHSYFMNSVSSLETIRNLNSNSIFLTIFDDTYQKYLKSYRNYHKVLCKNNFLLEVISDLMLIAGTVIGILEIQKGRMVLSDLLVMTSFLSLITSSLLDFVNIFFHFLDGKSSLNRIRELCDVEDYDIKKEVFVEKKIEKIEVNHLSYSYSYQNLCLENINFQIFPLEHVMITGESGIGKSTLAKLMMGYLNVKENQIFLSGVDINNYQKDFLKEHITYVSQNESLFPISIKRNITLDRNISEETFQKICKITKVDEMIKNNNLTYNLLLEENGFNLSGGQRQRIVLARSLVKKSDVYIFDESFCNLDVSLEREVLMGVLSYLHDKIVIVISHRFHNEDLFDKKIVLKNKKGEKNDNNS